MQTPRLVTAMVFAALTMGCGPRSPAASRGGADSTRLSVAALDSATRFAQHFYDWYARAGTPFEATLRDSSALFAPALLAALRDDIAESARHPGEVVGLDWDPFVASQDPCTSYHVGQVSQRGAAVLVPIIGSCSDHLPAGTPDLVAELARRGSTWAFANFRHGSDSGSVLSDLAALRAERGAAPVRAGH